MQNYDNYRFGKQFLITKQDIPGFTTIQWLNNWKKQCFADSLFIYNHPDLALSSAQGEGGEVLCLGECLDPDHTDANNAQIARMLADHLGDFSDLEARLARLAGRWVIIAKRGATIHLYHDAGGLKSVFIYRDQTTNNAFTASQPSLLAHVFSLPRRVERDAEINNAGASQWPPNAAPYDNITQLLPNHCLDLTSDVIQRYWPTGSLAPLGLDEAAAEIFSHLSAIVQASLKRKTTSVGVTGGYDSRVILAVAKTVGKPIRFFTMHNPWTPRYDIRTARRLARMLKLEHDIVKYSPVDPELHEILHTNSSHMHLDRSHQAIGTLAKAVRGGFWLPGAQGEALRCNYYKNVDHPAATAEILCRRMRLPPTPLAVAGIQKWLEDYPQTNIKPLDLLFWECRIGVWSGVNGAYREALMDVVPPMNCRYVLETGLRVDVQYRKPPFELFHKLYSLADERLSQPRFNTATKQIIVDRIARLPLFWRINRVLKKT